MRLVVASVPDECLGRLFGQGLLATTSADRCRSTVCTARGLWLTDETWLGSQTQSRVTVKVWKVEGVRPLEYRQPVTRLVHHRHPQSWMQSQHPQKPAPGLSHG